MRPDQQSPATVALAGAPAFAFSLLLESASGVISHTLTIIQNQPTKELALQAATRLAETSLPGYTVQDWICCKLATSQPS